jgi:uncharacterized protein with GYD domain
MATFLMLGRYSMVGIHGASAGRTKKVVAMMERCGGKVKSIYALLGGYDLAIVAEFPGVREAVKASFTASKATGISFSSLPAMPVAEFDKLIGR